MLVMMYHLLRNGVDYQELDYDYLDNLRPHRLTRYLVKRFGVARPRGRAHSR